MNISHLPMTEIIFRENEEQATIDAACLREKLMALCNEAGVVCAAFTFLLAANTETDEKLGIGQAWVCGDPEMILGAITQLREPIEAHIKRGTRHEENPT